MGKVVYTYESQGTQAICHAYTTNQDGSPIDEAQAEAAEANIKVVDHGVTVMILDAEALPSLQTAA